MNLASQKVGTSPSSNDKGAQDNDALALMLAGLADELQSREGAVLPSGRTVGDVLSDIAAKKHIIGTLPPCRDENGAFVPRSDRDGLSAKMAELKVMYEMVEELDKFAEQMRVEDVYRRHCELHPPNTMDCPICLESIPFTSLDCEHLMPCCGNLICHKCIMASVRGANGRMQLSMKKCPCCRESLLIQPNEMVPLVEMHAKKGRAWAQMQLGIYYLEGSSCQHGDAVTHQVDVGEALKWFKLAAEQRMPDAIRNLGQMHYGLHGAIKGVELCKVKARSLFKDAADLGNIRAQEAYAHMCRVGQGGPVDLEEAAYYYTLIHSQRSRVLKMDDESPELDAAVHFLGLYHYDGIGGMKKNLHRAKCYLEEAVDPEVRSEADLHLAACLVRFHDIYFGCGGLGRDSSLCEDYNVPGYSPIPRALVLYTKSAEKLGDEHPVKGVLKQLETAARMSCANCGKAADTLPDGKLKTCVRCKSSWYCSKDCQAQHWKAGHKSDCVKYNEMVPGPELYNLRRKQEFIKSMRIAAIQEKMYAQM